MYLQHFQLQQLPFRNTPDPRFFYETPRHNEALANLIYAVEQRRGFVLLSGEIGSGKTLVTHLLLQHLEDHAQVALIRNTHLNSSQLIRLVCDEFSVHVPAGADKATMLMGFNQFLIQQLTEDRLVVVIIDEAQNLSDKVLEELRMLSNLETSSDKLLQIVLVGQPELRDKVSQPHLEQLRQRIALSYHLEPLTLDEITKYIEHRLAVAARGETTKLGDSGRHLAEFTPDAVAKIARFSRGTPRIINGLCDNALLYAYTAGTHAVDEAIVDKVLKHSMHLAPRQHTPVRSPLSAFGGSPGNLGAGAGGGRATRVRPNPVDAQPSFPETASNDFAGDNAVIRPNPKDAEERPDSPQSPPGPMPRDAVGAEAAQEATEDDAAKKAEAALAPPSIPFPTLHIPQGGQAAIQ